MNDLTPFMFEGANVRVGEPGDDPWFVAAEVCQVLGINNSRMAVAKLDEDERDDVSLTDAIGREQMTNIVSESGLYTLILRCRDAVTPGTVPHRFRKWVTSEVLPTLRKKGTYGQDPIVVLNDPVAMRGLLLTYSEKVLALEAANAELTPKAEALDRIATADGSLCIRETAKALQIREKDLISYLLQHNWAYRRPGGGSLLGYHAKSVAGLVEHKVYTQLTADGNERIREQMRITPKGLSKLALLFQPQLRLVS